MILALYFLATATAGFQLGVVKAATDLARDGEVINVPLGYALVALLLVTLAAALQVLS